MNDDLKRTVERQFVFQEEQKDATPALSNRLEQRNVVISYLEERMRLRSDLINAPTLEKRLDVFKKLIL